MTNNNFIYMIFLQCILNNKFLTIKNGLSWRISRRTQIKKKYPLQHGKNQNYYDDECIDGEYLI